MAINSMSFTQSATLLNAVFAFSLITSPDVSLFVSTFTDIADLVTVASSYIRAWIPAIKSLEAEIAWSTVVVDRMQGGKEKLENEKEKLNIKLKEQEIMKCLNLKRKIEK